MSCAMMTSPSSGGRDTVCERSQRPEIANNSDIGNSQQLEKVNVSDSGHSQRPEKVNVSDSGHSQRQERINLGDSAQSQRLERVNLGDNGQPQRPERVNVVDSPIAPKVMCDNEKSNCSSPDLEKLLLQRALLRNDMRLTTMQEKLNLTENNFKQFQQEKAVEVLGLKEALVQCNKEIKQCNQEMGKKDDLLLALQSTPGLGALLYINSTLSLLDFYVYCVLHWLYDLAVPLVGVYLAMNKKAYCALRWVYDLGLPLCKASEAAIRRIRQVGGQVFFQVVKVVLFPVFELTDALLLYMLLAIGLLGSKPIKDKGEDINQNQEDMDNNNKDMGKNIETTRDNHKSPVPASASEPVNSGSRALVSAPGCQVNNEANKKRRNKNKNKNSKTKK